MNMKKTKMTIIVLIVAGLLAGCGEGGKANNELAVAAGLVGPGGKSTAEVGIGRPITRADIQTAFNAENDGTFDFKDNIWITTADGVKIAANTFVPRGIPAGTKLPAVVFVNSWAINEYEYLVPAAKLAKRGYVVISYSTRGFGFSGGLINVAGPKDISDLGSVLDYLIAQTPANVNNIGIAGISYGAGISLLGVSKEPRIKTAVAMSGWGNLSRSLYGNETPRLVWGLLLIVAGYFTGHMDPIIAEQFQRLLDHREVSTVLAWAAERSPATYVSALNAAGKPVYISNNLSDNLFQPNQTLDYFTQLTVPKKLDLNNGIHATAEIGGIIGLSNYVWDNAYAWFDYHLKGTQNGIMTKPMVTIQKKFSTDRVSYSSWPPATAKTKTYYLKPRSLFSDAKLQTTTNSTSSTNTILSGADTLATTGIPLLSDIVESHLEVPVYTSVGLISRVNGIFYESDFLSSAFKIRGRTFYKGRVHSSTSSAHTTVYLYDVDGWGTGKLITHGTATLHGLGSGDADLVVDLQAVAYDVPAGHRLTLALDTFDAQYAVPTLAIYSLDFRHSSTVQSTLAIESE